MARFRASEVDQYSGQGGSGFFQLKNDGDMATVRIMYKDANDIEGYAVHEIPKVSSKGKNIKQDVNCLRENPSDPLDVCPLCASGKYPIKAKVYIPIYDLDTQTTSIWSRGKTFFSKLEVLCKHYAKKGKQLASRIFDIERKGAYGDQKTTYEIILSEDDEEQDTVVTLEDLPDVPTPEKIVWDKTAEEMEYFLKHGEFPAADDDDEEEEPPRRRSKKSSSRSKKVDDYDEDDEDDEDDDEEEEEERRPRRRNRKDAF